MKITRLVITNYRGIAERDMTVPPAGAVVRGRNAAGKTSVLKAIRAALSANDIGEDAIRIGADKAEILVDLGDLTVRRAITKKGSRLEVKDAKGFTAAKPQTLLTELLGTSALDPLDLFLAKPAERRKKVLEALPVTVTREQLLAWAPDLPAGFSVEGHGLEVIERARAAVYEKRREANAAAKAAYDETEHARKAVPRVEIPADLASTPELQANERNAAAASQSLLARQRAAGENAARAAVAREQIAKNRAEAGELRARARATHPTKEETEPHYSEMFAVKQTMAELEESLASAKKRYAELEEVDRKIGDRERQSESFDEQAARLEELAATIEGAVGQLSAPAVDAAEIERAAAAVQAATAAVELGRHRDTADKARQELASKEKAARVLVEEAEALDKAVKALTAAPAALLASAQGIPGLSLVGDDVALNGVAMSGLSGEEQMRFAVRVARLLNQKSRILVVDGLERLDPEQYRSFVQEATADGYQLICTRVDSGEIVIEALEQVADVAAE